MVRLQFKKYWKYLVITIIHKSTLAQKASPLWQKIQLTIRLQFRRYWEYLVITITHKSTLSWNVTSAWHITTTDGKAPVLEIVEVPLYYHYKQVSTHSEGDSAWHKTTTDSKAPVLEILGVPSYTEDFHRYLAVVLPIFPYLEHHYQL